MKTIRLGAITLLLALGLCGCEDQAKPKPKTPQPTNIGPGGTSYVPKPGSGGAQYAIPDNVPKGAPTMNAEAMSLYQKGMAAFSVGDLKNAQSFFSQATQADPQAFQAYYSMGVVQERLGQLSAAAQSYRQAFTIVPKYETAIVAYGLVLAKQNKMADADRFLTEQRGKNQRSAAIAAALAEVKSLQNDSVAAQEMAQQALKINPAHAPAMMTIARDHYRNRRLDLSLYALKAVLDGFGQDNPPRDRDNAEGHLLRAFIFAERDQRVLAMESFRKALQLRPDIVVARLRFSTYLLESGGAIEALPILQRTVQYDPQNLDAHLSLGDAYRLTGDFQKAKQEFDWVRTKNANLPEVYYNLGLLYLFAPSVPGFNKMQQVQAAIGQFNKFKELRGKGAEQSDVDELLQRANLKKAEIEALEKAKKAPPPVPAPAAPAKPPAPGAQPSKTPAPPPAPAPAPAPAPGKTPAPQPVQPKTPAPTQPKAPQPPAPAPTAPPSPKK
ncbi:MAG TPA: tetratricopeptide repeat protein [Polyangiaceae bacterium]|nr:tetratricopeptide repeat protein [Polyangiaceae bacterium]